MNRVLFLALAAFLAAPQGTAQADARLYHQAWYLEHVARKPEEALDRYRRLCHDYPDSPLRPHALARQADLLRRLRRPREAALILGSLAQEAPDPAILRDQEALQANAAKIRQRDTLLRQLLRLRLELTILEKELAADPSSTGKSPEEHRRLQEEAQRLRAEIEALRPTLLSDTGPNVLEVKRQAQIQGIQSEQARQLGTEIVRLRDQARALEEAGKLREARQILQELERLKGRYRMALDRFRGRPGPFLAPESRIRFLAGLDQGEFLRESQREGPGRFWVRAQFVRFLTTPGEVLALDPARRRLLLDVLGQLVASTIQELKEQNDDDGARKLEAALEQVRLAEERGRLPDLEERLQELGSLMTPMGWRPDWPVPPGGRGGRGAPPPERGQRP